MELNDMFDRQVKFQKSIGSVYNQQFINIMILGAVDELMEALRETPWKPWKKQQT